MPVEFEMLRAAMIYGPKPWDDPHKKRNHGISTFTRSPKAGCPKRRGKRGGRR